MPAPRQSRAEPSPEAGQARPTRASGRCRPAQPARPGQDALAADAQPQLAQTASAPAANRADRHRQKLPRLRPGQGRNRSEEHTSELQSLMRISYAVFCLKKKKNTTKINEYKK